MGFGGVWGGKNGDNCTSTTIKKRKCFLNDKAIYNLEYCLLLKLICGSLHKSLNNVALVSNSDLKNLL